MNWQKVSGEVIHHRTRKALHAVLCIWAALCLFVVPGFANSGVKTDNVNAELVSSVLEIEPGGQFWVALRQVIRPGWHTYWKNPGDSGEPTRIEWNLPHGFQASAIRWPVPDKIPVGPLMNYGFKNEILLLTKITAPRTLKAGEQVSLNAHVRWLVCEEICIPEEGDVSLDLTVADGASVPDLIWQPEIAKAQASLPKPFPWSVSAAHENGHVILSFAVPEWRAAIEEGQLQRLEFFPYGDGLIQYAAPHLLRYGPKGFSVLMPDGYKVRESSDSFPFESVTGILVLSEQMLPSASPQVSVFDINAPIQGQSKDMANWAFEIESADTAQVKIGFVRALLYALFGGLLLNLMPCVFPVLSIKALSLMQHAQNHQSHLRRSGVLYGMGVITSFLGLGVVLIGLRAAGEQIGWGFQLQTPVIVAGLAYVMFAVALNLSGVFDVPGGVFSLSPQKLDEEKAWGSFATGVLAVAVATPCTAPFMGAALGFAVFQSAQTALIIFVGLGVGLALPFLLLSFIPDLGRLLPAPGPWMVKLRQVLALPMYGALGWLFWVLAQQVDQLGLVMALGGLGALGFGLWALGRAQRGELKSFAFGRGAIVFGALVAVSFLFLIAGRGPRTEPIANVRTDAGLAYEAYSSERVAQIRAQGKQVFVNFTAAWCITCLVNEQLVFRNPEVAARFSKGDLVYLKADWTNRDPVITKALAAYGRNGVPLYLLYRAGGHGEEDGIVLPQILTAHALLESLD